MIITQNNLFRNPKKILFLIKKKYKEKGFFGTIVKIAKILIMRSEAFLSYIFYYKYKNKNFYFNNKKHNYFYHPYNATWRNPRCIEVPIIYNIIKENKNKKILEIGNVLSHYFSVYHEILDKYEEDKNVINEDVTDFKTNEKYDLIVSISTFEHIGWDEEPKEPSKILKALKNIKNCLKSNGKIIFTIPVGENPYLDSLIKNKKIKLNELYCFKKMSVKNDWKQISFEKLKNIKCNSPFLKCNGIVIGVIKKKN